MENHLPSNLNRSSVLPSSRLATRNHKLLIQHNTTPTQLCAGILNRLSIMSWKAPLGIEINVVVSGLVAFTSNNVELKTAKDPRLPHQIINQKKGTSRK